MGLLRLSNVTKKFGGLVAVNNFSAEIEKETIAGIIGPNGAGKTTLLNLICGIYPLDSGDMEFNGKSVRGFRFSKIVRIGIGRTFQITRVFERMTVLENLLAVNSPERFRLKERAIGLLKYVEIDHLRDEYAGNLSGGQQKLLEFSRMLMLNPSLILLDESFAGIHPDIITKLMSLILDLREKGKTFVIVSHAVSIVTRVCEKLIVIDQGRKIADGNTIEVANSKEVINAYLGG